MVQKYNHYMKNCNTNNFAAHVLFWFNQRSVHHQSTLTIQHTLAD